MLSSIKSVIEIILKLFNLFKWADYFIKTKKREKLVEEIKNKELSETERLRALDKLSK